jgi:Pentapeptide repeats (8 copies)
VHSQLWDAMLCLSNCPDRSAIELRRVAKLSRVPLAALRSPWSWPIAPLVAVAVAGQWLGLSAAEAVAAVCGAVGFGVAIGLTVAGGRGVNPRPTSAAQKPSAPAPGAAPAAAPQSGRTVTPRLSQPRSADLRGARLAHSLLVRADLRHADLRHADLRGATLSGANLSGADLTGADLTGARLGPLDEGQAG